MVSGLKSLPPALVAGVCLPFLAFCFPARESCASADFQCAPLRTQLLHLIKGGEFRPLYVSGKFFGVGGLLESIDGSAFQQIGAFSDTLAIGGAVRSKGRLIAGGELTAGGCVIRTSDDEGGRWDDRNCNNVGDAIIDLAAGNGMIVAIGINQLVRVSLDNGDTWQNGAALAGAGNLNRLLFHGGRFYLATATGGVYTSTDPLNIAFTNPGGGAPAGTQIINHGLDQQGNYYAVDIGASAIHKFDGSTWTTASNLFTAKENTELAYAVAAGKGMLLAAGAGAGLNQDCMVDSTSDGVNFSGGVKMSSLCADLAGESYLINRLAYYNGKFIGTGLEIGAGTSKGIFLSSESGAAFSWTGAIQDSQTLYTDFHIP